MSTPVHVPMSVEQDEMYRGLVAAAARAQDDLNLFCTALFRGVRVTSAGNVQRMETPEGVSLVAEVP